MVNKANTETFTSETSWTVPNYVNEVIIECWASTGQDGSVTQPDTSASYDTGNGKLGGYTKGTLAVSSGETIYIRFPAGGYGRNNTMDGGTASSGEGGAGADARLNGTGLANVVIGAGGGGGGGAGFIVLNGTSNGSDMLAGSGGRANNDSEVLTWPPTGEDLYAVSGNADATPEGDYGYGETVTDTDNDVAVSTGGGGGGYDGGSTDFEKYGDDSGTTYARAIGGAGGQNTLSGVTNGYQEEGNVDSTEHEVRIHWEEVDREVHVSESGSFQLKPVYVSDGSQFSKPTNIHHSDGNTWTSKY